MRQKRFLADYCEWEYFCCWTKNFYLNYKYSVDMSNVTYEKSQFYEKPNIKNVLPDYL